MQETSLAPAASWGGGAGAAVVFLPAPFGWLRLTAVGAALTGAKRVAAPGAAVGDSPLLDQAARQLAEYFAGTRRRFTIPLAADGTEFQRRVWQALAAIPYGERRTYGAIAAAIGRPRASRAVGLACGRNPLLIFIPCHRVVGAGGSLGGFSAGLDAKAHLLTLEARRQGK